MPQRSNEFQRLVYLVKKVVGGSAVVTESKMLPDRRPGLSAREVDVCIEATIAGGHNVIVSIECCDHGRPADKTWVEQMKAKHEHLATKSLVLASRSGYTKDAVALAAAEGIELLGYDQLSEEEARNVFEVGSSVWGFTYSLTPTRIRATLGESLERPQTGDTLATDVAVFNKAGTQFCSVAQLVQLLLSSRQVAETLMREGSESQKSYIVAWKAPAKGSGQELFLQKASSPETFVHLEALEISGRCEISPHSEFKLTRSGVGSIRVAWGTTTLAGADAMFVAVKEKDNLEPRIALEVRPKVTVSESSDESTD